MVGLATVLVTGVSLYVALKATRGSNNQKVTEFRQLWIDDLRTHEFVGSVYETLNHSISSTSKDSRQRDLDIKHSELRRLESYVAMKLNSHEEDHRVLMQLVAQTRGRAAAFSVGAGSALAFEIDHLINLITEFSKLIYKVEWDRVRDDTYGRGRVSRMIRSFFRERKRKKRETEVRSKAADFFRQINLTAGAL